MTCAAMGKVTCAFLVTEQKYGIVVHPHVPRRERRIGDTSSVSYTVSLKPV